MKRKIYKLSSNAKQAFFALAFILCSGMVYSQTFVYTGTVQTVNLAAGNYSVAIWGADGGNAPNGTGGKGGYSQGTLTIGAASTYYIYVGGKGTTAGAPTSGGWNGGGNFTGSFSTGTVCGTGGGGSDIRTTSNTSYSNRIIVAGGGGGSTGYGAYTGNGGDGGGSNGGGGTSSRGPTYAGGGGSQVAGGTAATGGIVGYSLAGGLGFGGDYAGTLGGSAGGGGYYGGGSGHWGGSSGGGSSYIGGVSNGTTTMFGQPGFVTNPDLTGNGRVIITALCNINLTNYSTTGPGPICLGNSATLTTNAISNYSWSTGSIAASIVVSPTITTTYTLSATSPSNCTASAAITITVQNTQPTISIVTSTNNTCAGYPVLLTASGANTYTWTGGVQNGATYIPTSTSGYTVTGANACGSATAVTSISVNPSPSVTASVNNPTVCNGSSVILTAGGNATNYLWSGGVQNNVAFAPATSTSYTVIGGSVNSCTAAAVVNVTVFVTPIIAPVATPTSICLGSTAIFSAIGATGYTWTPGLAQNGATLSVSPLSTTTYTLFRVNGACTSTANVTLVINAIPVVVATASPTQICVGEPVVLNVFGAISYTWSPGNFSASNFSLYPNSSTCYTVAGSNGSCSAVSAICVSVNPSPAINILTPTISICEGSSITFTATGAPSYTWLTTGTNVNNSNITVTPSVTSQYTVLGSNAFNCVVAKTQLVVVNPAPSLNLTSNIPYACVGSAAILSVGATSPNGVYTWSGGAIGSGPSITVNPTITTSYIATGVNTQNGCASTNTITLAVYISTFVVSSPTAICKGSDGILSASGAATGYAWVGPNGNISNTSSVSVSPSNSTTYYVTGTTGSCTTTQTVPLIVNVLPNVTAVSAKPQLCRLEFGTVTASGATSYVWAHGVTTAMFTFNTLTITTTYTVTGTDNNGCSKTAFVTQYIATCAGIDALTGNNSIGLTIYPNPNNGNFTISSDVDITVSIVNAMGQVISTMDLTKENKNEITVSTLPAGIYFITGEKNMLKVNKKFIIQK